MPLALRFNLFSLGCFFGPSVEKVYNIVWNIIQIDNKPPANPGQMK